MTTPQQALAQLPHQPSGPEAERIPAEPWLSHHVALEAVRWANGWVVTANLWRAGRATAPAPLATDSLRSFQVHWPQQSPLSRAELLQVLWRSALLMATDIRGAGLRNQELELVDRTPGEYTWVKANASMIGTPVSTTLHAYLTGKGHTAKNPVESRLCSHNFATMTALEPAALLTTLGFLLEQHGK